jgi:PAS domain S-box-containing protein
MIEGMSDEIVRAIYETVPIEITVIDAKDEVLGWNKHRDRLFKRAATSMQMNFRECHPKESVWKVEQIVNEMKAGRRERARFWIDLPLGPNGEKHKVLIEFYALHDLAGKYIGCMECTRDVEEIRNLEGEKRLLD